MADLFNPNAPMGTQPDFAAQAATLAQQKRVADVLRRQQLADKAPQGEMVSGHYVAPSWTEHLSGIFNQYQAGQAERDYGKAEEGMAKQAESARQTWQSSLPQAVAARAELAGPRAENGSPELDAVAAKPVTEEQVIRHQLAGMAIPGNEKAAGVYGQGALAQINREDTQEARREAQAATIKAARDKQMDDLQVKREKIEADSKASAQTEETRRMNAAALNAVNLQIAEMRAATARETAESKKSAAADKITHLPAAQTTAYIGNQNAIGSIDRAIELVKANPGAVGVKGFLPNAILARQGSDADKAARAEISNIGSLKIHDRSGATVTAAESPRLMPFIPTINDPPETVAIKLRGLKREAERNNLTIEEFAETNKYHRPGTTKITPDELRVVRTGTKPDGTKVEELSDGTVRNVKR